MEQQARNGNVRYVRCYCEVENLYYKGCRLKVFLQLKKFLRDAATHKDERKERSKFNQPRFSSKGIGVTAPFMLA